MEVSERLLEELIERIESTEAKHLEEGQDYADSSSLYHSSPFHPESQTLSRNYVTSLDEVYSRFGMADVIAYDRLFKQVEKGTPSGLYLWEFPLFIFAFRGELCADWLTISRNACEYNRRHVLEVYMEGMSDGVSGCEVEDAFSVVVAAVLHLLAFVFQYLMGCVDRGGSKTYSSGCFDFRATFVSLVLFQGAYVWIKFRQAAPVPCLKRKASDTLPEDLKGLHRRVIEGKVSGTNSVYKYEPRITIPREEVGGNRKHNHLYLGTYYSRVEACIVVQIARSYYSKDGKDGSCVELENGKFKRYIPPMREREHRLAGEEKRKWVAHQAKKLGKQMYADFLKESRDAGYDVGSSDPSLSAQPVTCSSPTTIAREPVIVTEVPLCPPSSSLLPCDDGTVAGSTEDTPSGCDEKIVELSYLGFLNPPPEQSDLVTYDMHYQAFAQILEDSRSPEGADVAQGPEHGQAPHFSPSSEIQQRGSLVDAVVDTRRSGLCSNSVCEQLVDAQKKQLENSAIQFIHMDHQLKLSQIQMSELQKEIQRLKHQMQQEKDLFEQEKQCLHQEIELLKMSKLEQHLHQENEQVGTSGHVMDIQQRH